MKPISKKHKIWLGSSAAILGSAAIIAPLVSCSNKEDAGKQFDKEYNVTEATYKNMKKQLESQVDKVIQQQAKAELDEWEGASLSEVVEAKRNQFNHYMQALDDDLNGNNGEKKSFTQVTGCMAELATSKYGIKLNRFTTASWADLNNEFIGVYNNTKTWMEAQGFDEDLIKEKLQYAWDHFKDLNKKLLNKYGSGDPLSGITNGRNEIAALFDGVNEDISYQAAETKLKDFLSDYTITLNDDDPYTTENDIEHPKNTFEDIVEGIEKEETKKINLFEAQDENIVNNDDEHLSKFQLYFTVRDKDENDVTNQFTAEFFSEKAILGYNLLPTLEKIVADNVNNRNHVFVDWKLEKDQKDSKSPCKDIFRNKNDAETIVVHLYKANEQQAREIANKQTVKEALTDELIDYKSDLVIHTAADEKLALDQRYFSSTATNADEAANIELTYSVNPDMDAFVAGTLIKDPEGDEATYSLTVEQLANTGIAVYDGVSQKTEKLSDLLVWKDQETTKVESEQIPDNQLSNLQKFIKYVDLRSIEATVDKYPVEPTKQHTVDIKVEAEFANTKYEGKATNGNEWYETVPCKKLEGISFSKQYFSDANEGFNDAYTFFQMYDQKEKFDKLETAYDIAYAAMIAVAVASSLVIAIYTLKCIIPFTGPLSRAAMITGIVFLAVILALNASALSIYGVKEYKPAKKFIANVKDFRKYKDPDGISPFDQLRNKLENDKQYFSLRNENGTYNRDDYNTKQDYFTKHLSVTQAQDIHNYYCSFATQIEYINFITAAELFKVEPEQYFKRLKECDPFNGTFMVCIFLIGTAIITAGAMAVILRDIESANVQQLTEAAEEGWEWTGEGWHQCGGDMIIYWDV